MKKILLGAAMITLLSTSAFAQTATSGSSNGTSANANANSSSTSTAASGSVSGANASNGAVTTVNANYFEGAPANTTNHTTIDQNISGGTDSRVHSTYGTQTIKNTPSVSGPPLVSSNDTCMGAASGSANVPGFGLSIGKTYTDDNCVMLKNARELWNMGMKAAAMARMCMDSDNRKALEITGFVCPQSGVRTVATSGPVSAPASPAVSAGAARAAGEPTDPYVRDRLGLPPIKE